jgi:hypothetical protein
MLTRPRVGRIASAWLVLAALVAAAAALRADAVVALLIGLAAGLSLFGSI